MDKILQNWKREAITTSNSFNLVKCIKKLKYFHKLNVKNIINIYLTMIKLYSQRYIMKLILIFQQFLDTKIKDNTIE